jgi:hypothetical protein
VVHLAQRRVAIGRNFRKRVGLLDGGEDPGQDEEAVDPDLLSHARAHQRGEIEEHPRARAPSPAGDDDDAHLVIDLEPRVVEVDAGDLRLRSLQRVLNSLVVAEEHEAREGPHLAGAGLEVERLRNFQRGIPPLADVRVLDEVGAEDAREVHLGVQALVGLEGDLLAVGIVLEHLLRRRFVGGGVSVYRQVGDAGERVDLAEALEHHAPQPEDRFGAGAAEPDQDRGRIAAVLELLGLLLELAEEVGRIELVDEPVRLVAAL